MKRLLLLSLAIGIMFMSAGAQDQPLGRSSPKEGDGVQKGARPSKMSGPPVMASIGKRSSPFPTPTPTDTLFVVDEGGSLDTSCTFRSAGPLTFTVNVKRYVGEVDGQGRLLNPQKLVDSGVVSSTVTVRMPAYDVDYGTQPPNPHYPERDRVLFNGYPVGDLGSSAFLDGENNRWRINEFTIPVEYVRFGRKVEGGEEPTPGQNEITILIDEANLESGDDVWCTAIDWASISFSALAPVIMVHGDNQAGAFWDEQGFTKPFKDAGVPYDNSISLPGDYIAQNGNRLLTDMPRVARQFGAKHVHIVAHSKGGLDTREFLKKLPVVGQLAVVSFTTLSTPHEGSVVADYVRDSKGANATHSDSTSRTRIAKLIKYSKSRQNLTTKYLKDEFNPKNLPLPGTFFVDGEETGVTYLSYGADANLNDSFDSKERPTITDNEMDGTGWFTVIPGVGQAGQILYRLLYYVEYTTATPDAQGRMVVKESPDPKKVKKLKARNDLLVTVKSSQLPQQFLVRPEQKRNHATVADGGIGGLVLDAIRSIQPMPEGGGPDIMAITADRPAPAKTK